MNTTPAIQITCAEEEDFYNLPWPHSQVNKFISIEVFKNKILAYPRIRRFLWRRFRIFRAADNKTKINLRLKTSQDDLFNVTKCQKTVTTNVAAKSGLIFFLFRLTAVFINFQLTYNIAVVTLRKTLTVITIPLIAYIYVTHNTTPTTIYVNRYTRSSLLTK